MIYVAKINIVLLITLIVNDTGNIFMNVFIGFIKGSLEHKKDSLRPGDKAWNIS